jgi:ClpP class serine protease
MKTIPYAHAAARIFDTPLLMHPTKARQIAGVLNERQRKRADDDWYDDFSETVVSTGNVEVTTRSNEPIYNVVNGAAIIPINGSLAHKTGDLHASSGIVGYDGLTAKLRLARADDNVAGIWLDFNSYGGEVNGCFDLADEIREGSARGGGKPVWSCINESAFSAAYALASQADVVLAPRTAGCGSIGVVMMHADYSEMLKADGVKVTLIHAGEHKVDGNPYEALPQDVYQTWLASCESVRSLFAETVAKGRGISVAAALATEARCYDAAPALAIGLIDSVVSAAAGLDAFIAHLNGQ